MPKEPKPALPDDAAGRPDAGRPDEIAKRLARVAGHAASLKRLWDEGRECEEMLTQISAVRAALDQTGKAILEHHIDHCVTEALERGRADEAVRDLKKALDRLI